MTQLSLLEELTGTSFTGVLQGVHPVGQTPLLAGRAKVSGQTFLFELPDLPPSSMFLRLQVEGHAGDSHAPAPEDGRLRLGSTAAGSPMAVHLRRALRRIRLHGPRLRSRGIPPRPLPSAVCNVLRFDKVHVFCCDVATPHLGRALLRHLQGI